MCFGSVQLQMIVVQALQRICLLMFVLHVKVSNLTKDFCIQNQQVSDTQLIISERISGLIFACYQGGWKNSCISECLSKSDNTEAGNLSRYQIINVLLLMK